MKTSIQKEIFISILLALAFMVAQADTLYVTDDSKVVTQFDTNDVGSVFVQTGNGPQGEAFDTAGNLYVANYTDGTIVKFATNGDSSVFASGLNGPWALAFDGAGYLYVANFDDNTIWKFYTNQTGSVYINTGLNDVDGLAFDKSGALYAANYNSGDILKFTTPDNHVVFANVNAASGIAFDSSGNLYVADYDDNKVWRVDTNGVSSVFVTDNLAHPNDVAFDNAGNLYVANATNGKVTRFSPDGSTNSTLTASGMVGAEFIAVWPIPAQLIPVNVITEAPSLSSAILVNNQFQFTVTGTSGVNYIVQAATNLVSPDWLPVFTNAAPYVFVESNSDLVPQKFYRAVLP